MKTKDKEMVLEAIKLVKDLLGTQAKESIFYEKEAIIFYLCNTIGHIAALEKITISIKEQTLLYIKDNKPDEIEGLAYGAHYRFYATAWWGYRWQYDNEETKKILKYKKRFLSKLIKQLKDDIKRESKSVRRTPKT